MVILMDCVSKKLHPPELKVLCCAGDRRMHPNALLKCFQVENDEC